jgi:hypothetical protein
MLFDYQKLLGKVIEKYGKQYVFAKAMSWSERTCSKKLTGQIEWRQSEILKACKLLGITENEVVTYFFTLKVL